MPDGVLSARVLKSIRDHSLCVPCIAREVPLAESEVRETIANAPVGLAIRGGERVCERCNIIRHTYRISTPRPKPETRKPETLKPEPVKRSVSS